MLAAELQQLAQSAGNQIVSTSRHAPPTAGIPDHEGSSQIQTGTPGKIWPAACRQNGCDPDFQRRPQASAQSSNLFVNLTTIRGRTRRLLCLENLQGESPVSNSAFPARVCFAGFVAFGPHPISRLLARL